MGSLYFLILQGTYAFLLPQDALDLPEQDAFEAVFFEPQDAFFLPEQDALASAFFEPQDAFDVADFFPVQHPFAFLVVASITSEADTSSTEYSAFTSVSTALVATFLV